MRLLLAVCVVLSTIVRLLSYRSTSNSRRRKKLTKTIKE